MKLVGESLSIVCDTFTLYVVLGPSAKSRNRRKEYAWRLTAWIAAVDLLVMTIGFIFDVVHLTTTWRLKDGSWECNLGGFAIQFSSFSQNLFTCLLAIVVHRLAASEGMPKKTVERWWHSACILLLALASALSPLGISNGYHPASPWGEEFPYCWLTEPLAQQLVLYIWVYVELAFVFAIFFNIFWKIRKWASSLDSKAFRNKRLILADSFLIYPAAFFLIWIGPVIFRISRAFSPCESNCSRDFGIFITSFYRGLMNACTVAFRIKLLDSLCACFSDKCRSKVAEPQMLMTSFPGESPLGGAAQVTSDVGLV